MIDQEKLIRESTQLLEVFDKASKGKEFVVVLTAMAGMLLQLKGGKVDAEVYGLIEQTLLNILKEIKPKEE